MLRSITCAVALAACSSATAGDPPHLAIVGESTRLRLGDPLPATSPWFDGARVSLVAARGETLGLQIVHRGGSVQMSLPGAKVRHFAVESFDVKRPSTALYGGSHGAGRYADGLVDTASPTTNPAYVEITVPRDAASSMTSSTGTLVVDGKTYAVDLAVANVTLDAAPPRVWAYADPRELATEAGYGAMPANGAPSPQERSCAAMFREHGVLLSPDLPLAWWAARRGDFAGIRDVPVVVSTDPAKVGDDVRGWIAATRGTEHVPFSIPIDEPRTPARRREVVALGTAIRAAGGGPSTFRLAVTADPRPEYLGLVDQFIQLRPAANSGAWQYNGVAPTSGSMVLDAETPGARTWGWIAHRDAIAQWYVWDALYWHDRHNRKGAPRPGKPLEIARDPVSFDDGEDRGNLDGVLALPAPEGCRPTLRLAALRRGQQDRALLALAQRCDATKTAALVARVMPAKHWSTNEADWERARRELLTLASCATSRTSR